MLVLSRKKGEQVVIDSRIQVTILGIRGNTVRIGIAAPDDVPVHREELFRRIESKLDHGLALPYNNVPPTMSPESV